MEANPVHILIVDDDPDMCTLMRYMLERPGFKIDSVQTVEAAQEELRRQEIQLLIADVNLPGSSGIDLIRLALLENRDLAAIIITGAKFSEHALKAYDIGAFGYLLKPFERTELSIKVNTALDMRRLRIENRDYQENLERLVSARTAELKASNLALIKEIDHRKKLESSLRKTSLDLQAISRCTNAIVHAKDEEELLNRVCRHIVEIANYRLAWIGMAINDRQKSVKPAAQFGSEERYLDSIEISWDDTPAGQGPTGSAIRNGRTILTSDILGNPECTPWRESARQRG